MSTVIINDFEVITKPAASGDADSPTSDVEQTPPAPTPRDVIRAIRHQIARLARVRAH